LKGNTESIDSEGNVTPQSLGKYVYRAIMSLPLDKRPRQTPITRAEESGNIVLASYLLGVRQFGEFNTSALSRSKSGDGSTCCARYFSDLQNLTAPL
jgi:hypothetical protein